MANELDQEISPYLLQHKDNPVHWKAWGDPAFRLAKAENKPILISIGYAACHWCHVMAHESFEDPDIADFLNTHFICIKVDREERPDVDALYMQAVQMMQVPGGWPLNVFVTPEGRPFFGGTYFPPEPMYGRASFKQILHSVNKAWQTDQDKIHEHSEALTQALQHDTHYSKDSNLPALTSLYQVCEHMLSYIDKAEGGLQGAPKFPQLPMWLNLTDVAISQNNLDLLTAVKQTANALCQGGIYDHLDGGLMRYSTDSHWLVPHFEKMLYDNAQFLQLLAKLYSLDKNPLYKERAIETVNWLKQSMMTDCGAFACAIDADSEGVEGKYYVWSAEEINSILGRDTPLFNRVYGVSESGNWESYNILHRNHMAQISEPEAIKLAELRKKLLAERAKRIAPHRDDKVLADWNGLMISGLTYAAMAFERPDWLALAQSCYQAIIKHLADGNELYHMYRAGQKKHIGMLDDYANMVQAALLLYQATGNNDYLAQAKNWAQTVESHFRDPAGGYFSTSSKSQDLIAKVKLGQDQACPSGNGIMALNLTQLYYLSGENIYREHFDALAQSFAHRLAEEAPFYSSLVQAIALMQQAIQITLVGDENEEMLQAAWQATKPYKLIIPVSNTQNLPKKHPAYGKTIVSGKTTAYICQQQTCSAPITQIDELYKKL